MLFTLQRKRHKPINVDEADKILYLDFRVEENRSEQSSRKKSCWTHCCNLSEEPLCLNNGKKQ